MTRGLAYKGDFTGAGHYPVLPELPEFNGRVLKMKMRIGETMNDSDVYLELMTDADEHVEVFHHYDETLGLRYLNFLKGTKPWFRVALWHADMVMEKDKFFPDMLILDYKNDRDFLLGYNLYVSEDYTFSFMKRD